MKEKLKDLQYYMTLSNEEINEELYYSEEDYKQNEIEIMKDAKYLNSFDQDFKWQSIYKVSEKQDLNNRRQSILELVREYSDQSVIHVNFKTGEVIK